jgi:HEAT repeat protein
MNAMRASLITLFALLVLAATLVSAGADPGAEKDKKQSPKASTTEIETLVKDLGSEDGKKASAALKSLVKIGQPAVSALFDALDKNEQENKRCLAILALGRIREKLALGSDERGSKVIEDRLLIELDDPNDEILSVATSALTENHPRSTKSIPVLIAIMKSEERRSLAR